MSTEITDEEIEEEIEKALLMFLRGYLVKNPHGCISIQDLCTVIKDTGLNRYDPDDQRRFLTGIYDLFRNGYLAWGEDFNKLEEKHYLPPHCHITHRVK